MSTLTDAQVAQLLRGINPARVAVLDGLSHLEAYDVRAHLIRIFGFGGWSGDVLDMTMLYEQPTETRQGKPAFKVAYRCTYRLTVAGATYTEVAVGESVMPDFKRGDAHDMAAKTAESQALKRCATNLGDQFGLSLYRKGSAQPLVVRTLVGMTGKDETPEAVDAGTPTIVPEQQPEAAPETPTGASDTPVVEAAPPPVEEVEPPSHPTDEVAALRERVIEAMQERNKNTALQLLTRINMEAGQRKLMNAQTTKPNGEPITLAVLIDEAIKHRTRGAA